MGSVLFWSSWPGLSLMVCCPLMRMEIHGLLSVSTIPLVYRTPRWSPLSSLKNDSTGLLYSKSCGSYSRQLTHDMHTWYISSLVIPDPLRVVCLAHEAILMSIFQTCIHSQVLSGQVIDIIITVWLWLILCSTSRTFPALVTNGSMAFLHCLIILSHNLV